MTESEIQAAVMRKLGSRPDTRIFRNHTGSVQDRHGRWHTFGLAKGSADLIGWQSIEITADMVGQRIAQFLSVEVKTPTGRVRPEQEAWARTVNAHGGRAVVVRSADDL